MGETGLPKSALSLGGRYGYVDDGETPNTQISLYEYDTAPLLFEVRGLPKSSRIEAMDAFLGIRIGVVIHCEHGYFTGGSGGGWVYDNDGKKIKQFVGTGGVKEHAANFIQAIRDRKSSGLNGPIEDGHISSALVHLANISYRMGAMNSPDKISRNPDAHEALERTQAHLKMNRVSLDEHSVRIGPKLWLSSVSESFVSHEAFDAGDFANRLLKRGTYREPFVVPDRV